MRQLLKNTFTLALALVFTAGMAFGQQVVNNQSGGSSADIQQTIPTVYANPHTVHGASARGSKPVNGSGLDAFDQVQGSQLEATQTSGAGNHRSKLIGDQLDGTQEIYVQQAFGANFARIVQRNGTGNLVKLRQKGTGPVGAEARFSQTGDNNIITGLNGSNNQLDGGTTVWTGDTHTENGNGLYSASQKKNDLAVIRQRNGNNKARFAQEGGNALRINQFDGSVAEIYQNGSGNIVSKSQYGPAFKQQSSNLYVTQFGDNNKVLGSQMVPGSAAYVNQTGGNNNTVINSMVW
jgi:hypothetical protein